MELLFYLIIAVVIVVNLLFWTIYLCMRRRWENTVIAKLLEKQGELKTEVDTLKSDNNELSSKVDYFIVEMESLRVTDREFRHQMEERDEKIKSLGEKYEELQGEEQRLNLARRELHESTCAASLESSAIGAVTVAEVDVNAGSVTITNSGDQEEDLGGFFVQRIVDDEDATNDFIFPSGYVLAGQSSVTIWNESSGATPNPSTDIVLEGDWLATGKSVVTCIVNTESKVIARATITEVPSSGGPTRMSKKIHSRESCVVM